MSNAEDRPLTPKQARFVQEYLVDLNATAAALRAGYASRSSGAKIITYPQVIAAIERARGAREDRTKIDQNDVIRAWHAIATTDLRDVLKWSMGAAKIRTGEVTLPEIIAIDSSKLTDKAALSIAEVSMSKDGTFKIKMHDKMKALDSLARHLGMFERDNEQVGKAAAGTVAALIEQAQGTPLRPVRHDDDG